jgi:single-stranded-DNA-specific exonuclease
MREPHRWIIAPADPAADRLAADLKTSPLLAQILCHRGITEPVAARAFLNPSLKLLHEPQKIAGIETAAARILEAIAAGERIVIYGDYDVDGITGTAILWHAIHQLGGRADYYIPHRLEEGYGLNTEAVGQLCRDGARLIVSVDCGITALEQARICRQQGVDLVITDHHEWRHDAAGAPVLPECRAIVHPRLPSEAPAPNPHLCGAGVALKLAWALGQGHARAQRVSDAYREFLLEALALAALGTIADVVPLTGENRLLAHFGLLGLPRSKLPGIAALIESARLTGKQLESYDVGFLLAPRLNAAGRMGHARQAVEMLTTAPPERAAEIAAHLERQNRARQTVERQIFQQAMEQAISLGLDRPEVRGVVLGAPGWHAGIVGIVASRVVSRLHKPAILLSLDGDRGHGSGRSIPGFHLARALEHCADHLESYGGHEMAAGMRVRGGAFESFRAAFAQHAAGQIDLEMLTPELRLDGEARLAQLNMALVCDLKRLGPFGTANHRPRLCCLGAELAAAPRRVGQNGEHVQLLVRQNGTTLKAIAFNRPDLAEDLSAGSRIDLAFEAQVNEYNGFRNVELEVVDVRPPGGKGAHH